MKRLSKLAAGLAITWAATAANAVTLIDFTDGDLFPGVGGPYDFGDFTLTITANPNDVSFSQNFDGAATAAYCDANGGPLDCGKDGLGIGDDEITYSAESATLSFSSAVTVTGLYFLDLFQPRSADAVLESAFVEVNSGASFEYTAVAPFQTNGGYLYAPVAFDNVTSLVFTAGSGNDRVGKPDFALAGLKVTSVPGPATLVLLGIGLVGLGALRRLQQ
jgi:hypothetical protein